MNFNIYGGNFFVSIITVPGNTACHAGIIVILGCRKVDDTLLTSIMTIEYGGNFFCYLSKDFQITFPTPIAEKSPLDPCLS